MSKISTKADFATFPVSYDDDGTGRGISNIIGATGAGNRGEPQWKKL